MTSHQLDTSLIQNLRSQYQDKLKPRDAQFLQRVYSTPSEKYQKRLKAIGFSGLDNVLDAGCGFGQWSLALAQLNQNVCAVDAHGQRLEFLSDVVKRGEIKNLTIQKTGLEKLPFRDNEFDAVFCYSVIYYTNWKKTLSELARVLKPKGLIYMTAPGIGWYVHLWLNRPNASAGYEPRDEVALCFSNTREFEHTGQTLPGADILIDPEDMIQNLKLLGFSIIGQGGEGTLQINSHAERPEPFFQSQYGGLLGCYEVLAKKS